MKDVKIKKTKKSCCAACNGENTKTYLMTYPVKLGKKQLDVGRVSVRECLDCGVIKPTQAGQAKVERSAAMFMSICGEHDVCPF